MKNIVHEQLSTKEQIEHWLQLFEGGNEYCSNQLSFPGKELTLNELWKVMDLVWEEMGCDSDNIDPDRIAEYYRHPIWVLNGFFVENHDVSLQHRHAIADWIAQSGAKKILDFGGGFGTLARIISDKVHDASIEIYEPYPSQESLILCKSYNRINFVDSLQKGYNCLVSTDVLEHVVDPLDLFSKMIDCVKLDGYLLIGNHFYPSIKCHLPTTFHFRYSFDNIAREMGLTRVGLCHGSHATIYRKVSESSLNWKKVRRKELFSRLLFPLLESKSGCKHMVKKTIKGFLR